MLTIAMLLSNFMSLLANDKYDTPLRGIEWKSDTVKITIPIELLRKANIKMIFFIFSPFLSGMFL